MSLKFNPFTGTLDIVGASSSGGDVFGPSSATDKGIARYDGITGKLIQDSKALVQDGGAVQTQAILINRVIEDLVTIPTNFTMLVSNVEIENGEIVIDTDAELVIL